MGRHWIGKILIVLWVSSFCFSEARKPIAKFSNVTVEGVIRKSRNAREVDAFMGIPYAEPPIGELRFRNPIPKVYTDGFLQANRTGIYCVQNIGGVIGNEDCLYLNVYRPASLRRTLLPVMVYIHGGAYNLGTADVSLKGPDHLLDKDIVYVIMNYRLGVFGFLSTGDEAAPGNFGLKDQKLALEWVQSNIAAFGGDSKRVTLFGQSTGAGCVHIHALVNHTDGLFHRYILNSGTALAPWSVKNTKMYLETGTRLGTISGCTTKSSLEMVDCLRKIESGQLLGLSMLQFNYAETGLSKTWGPTVEPISPGAYLTESPIDLLARNKQRDLPFFAGVTQYEGLFFTTGLFGYDLSYDSIINGRRDVFDTTLGFPDLVKNVIEFYSNGSMNNDTNTIREQLEDFLTDDLFFYPLVKVLEERRRNSRKSFYFYSFNYRGTLSNTPWPLEDKRIPGASHDDDLIYLFHPSGISVKGNLTFNQNDYRVMDTVVDLWTSFATQGVPRSKNVESWKPYNSQCQYLQIGDNDDPRTFLKSQFQLERMKFWSKITRESWD